MNAFNKLGPAIVLIAPLVLLACGKKHESLRASLPSVPVQVHKVEAKPHVAFEDVVGTVNPRLRAVIEAKVSGRIEKMLATPGQHVKAGDLLVELDVREIQAKLDQAIAVREHAESELERFTGLLPKRAVSQQEVEAAESRARVARAAVAEAETMLGYTTINAPFDGVITRKLADVGDLASPGKPLLEMEDPTALRFEAGVPDAIIGRIALGAELDVRIGENRMKGTVSEIAPAADPGSRTSLVKLDLPSTPGLRAGQFGHVSVPLTESDVLRVPASAIVLRGQMELVFVVEEGRAQLRLVKTGKQLGDEIEVVSGVNAGEQVVTEGATGLIDGQPVEIRQ